VYIYSRMSTKSGIIDFHTHTFPDSLAPRAMGELARQTPAMRNVLDGTRAALRLSMEKCGIAAAVMLPIATKPSHVQSINDDAAAANSADLVAFGALHPGDTDFAARVSFMQTSGIKGIKLHPEYQDFFVDDRRMFPAYEAVQAAGLIVVFHAGEDPGPFSNTHSLPEGIARVGRAFPRLRIVAAHMGGHRMWDDVERCLCGMDIFFDTSAVHETMAPELFCKIARLHGTEKLLFGSDSPWFDQKQCVEWIERLPFTGAEKERIFSENARALLGI
jgi:predicted TIM-barrel fold metal-dependent hydrolase